MWLLSAWFAAFSPHFILDRNGSRGKMFIMVSPFDPRFTENSGRHNFSLFWPELNHFSMLFLSLQKRNPSLRLSAQWENAAGSGQVLSAEQLRHSAHGWWWISAEIWTALTIHMHEAINAVNHLDCSRYCQKSLQHSHNNHNHTIRCPGNESFWGVQALQGLQSLGQSISRDRTLTLSLSTSAATLQTDCPSRVEEPHWICLCVFYLPSWRGWRQL